MRRNFNLISTVNSVKAITNRGMDDILKCMTINSNTKTFTILKYCINK